MTAPFVAGITRLIVATVGRLVRRRDPGLGPRRACSRAIAVGMVCFGGLIAGPLLVSPWGPKRHGRVKLSSATGASDAAALDDRNLEPQPR